MYFRTLEDAEKYLFSLDTKGMKLGLKTTTQFLSLFGHPERKFRSVLVAGTNGKGSTVTMLSAILKEAGYAVGSYYSPHVLDIRERIQRQGRWISKRDFVGLTEEIFTMAKRQGIELTFFEFMTAMAFIYFFRKKVDIACVEVGLGGRFDATNVVVPEVSVITSIGLDHQHILGRTLGKIAYEKAGIVKRGIPLVTAVAQSSINTYLKQVAHRRGSEHYNVHGDGVPYALALKGVHQANNAACVLKTIQLLNAKSRLKISERAIQRGLETAYIAGRFEYIKDHKTEYVLDGAHNPHGIRALIKSLNQHFPEKSVHYVVSILKDKNYEEMLFLLGSHGKSISFFPLETTRALHPYDFHQSVQHLKIPTRIFPSMPKALEQCKRRSCQQHLTCITGSLLAVREAKRYL